MDVRSHVPGPEHSAHPCQHCPVTSGVLPVRGYGQFGDNVLIKKLLEDKEQKGGKAGKSWKDCQAVGLAALSEPFPCKLFPMNRAGKPVGALPVAAALQMLLGWDPAGCGGQPPPQGFGGRGPQALAVGCGPQNRGEAPKEKCLLPWDTGRPDTPPCLPSVVMVLALCPVREAGARTDRTRVGAVGSDQAPSSRGHVPGGSALLE